MKRFILNCKKVIAVMLLCMIVVCGFSSISKANVSYEAGRRYNKDKGYQSITKVYAYENNGVAMKIRAGAYIGSSSNEDTGLGYVNVKTGWVKKIANAEHAYVIGIREIKASDKFVNNNPM